MNWVTSCRLLTVILLLVASLGAPACLAEGSNATDTRVLAPTTGTINNLVVFVRFSDQPEFSQPLSYYDGAFNSASNSLKNFYLENSYNAVTVNSTFYPTTNGTLVSYKDSHPSTYYQAYNSSTNPLGYQGAESTTREVALVSAALAAIGAQIPNGLNLDSNNDGYVDHLTFEVYSSATNPLPILFYSRATYDTTGAIKLGGKKLGAYTWVSAAQDTPNTGSALAATEIHEMGHSFGYPDLRVNSGRESVGDWDVMSNSTKVVHSGAYMKYKFTHWIANIPEISAYGSYTLNDLTQATNNSYKIKIPNSSEFLIVEYRKAKGVFESNLFGSGLCITRVNESVGMWGNLSGPPFLLYYFRQDGTLSNDGYGNAWNACLSAETGRTQFNDHSNPACFVSSGSGCGISLTNIGSAAGASISFSLSDPANVSLTHRISGIVSLGGSRVSGATVTVAGSSAGEATTDSLGNYSLTVSDGGNYIVTPSKANLAFSPASETFSNLTSDQSQNFSASNNTNTISGTVKWGGVPMAGITVVCNSGCTPQLATTDAMGMYSFTVAAGANYDVYLGGLTGYYAAPYSQTFTNVVINQAQDFSLSSITTVALTSSANPVEAAQSLTLTAVVSGSTVAGSVTFTSGGVALCDTVAVSNGQALCTTSSMTVGAHSLLATYSGDSRHSGSTSDALVQNITAASVTVISPLHPFIPANLAVNASIPDMQQPVSGASGATLLNGFSAVIAQATGLGINAAVQNDSGVLNLSFAGGKLVALPVGEIVVNTFRSDGVLISGSNIQVTSKGQVITIAPSVGSFADFAQQLSAIAAGSSATIGLDGTIRASISGVTYVLQPAWVATPTQQPAGLHTNKDGYFDYVDSVSFRQLLYPAFADLSQLITTFRQLDANLSISASGNGSFVATLNGRNFTLVPDPVLVSPPVEHTNDPWWQSSSGKLFIRYSDGKAQGFSAK